MESGSPTDNRSGPRLPSGPRRHVPECWRCAEDRRVLREYGAMRFGKLVGSMVLCDPCAESLTPLNPDPLSLDEAA